VGEVFIRGYRARLSDLINSAQPFLNVANAQLYGSDGILSYPFICINKQTIRSIIEESTASLERSRSMDSVINLY
jgi:hypothetical protein